MHEYHSQHRVLTIYSYTSFAIFLAKHVGKHSSGTFYVAFRDAGQILIIRDCPGDSGTVGAYGGGGGGGQVVVDVHNLHLQLFN